MRRHASVADSGHRLDVERYAPRDGGMGLRFRGYLDRPGSWETFYETVVGEMPHHESMELDMREVDGVSPNGGIVAVACIVAARKHRTDVSFIPSGAVNRALEMCKVGRLLARYAKEPADEPSEPMEPVMAGES